MDSSRRKFLGSSGLILTGMALPVWARGSSPFNIFNSNVGTWPILQAATDANSATINILHGRAESLSFQVTGGVTPARVGMTQRHDLAGGSNCITEVLVTGLVGGMDYQLEVRSAAGKRDLHTFRSLEAKGDQCRFAVLSCMNDSYTEKATTMWQALAKENCDFVVFLGDTVYADSDNPNRDEAGYARRYSEARALLYWFRMPRLVPSFATWDDHDYGLNNSDRSFPMREYTKSLFRSFWGAMPNSLWTPGLGVSSSFRAFGQRFFLFDDRSFRDAPGIRGGKHWGVEQTDWLMTELTSSSEPAWLLNGSQFFGAYLGKESFEGNYADDFQDVLRRLSRVNAPLAFVSGDIHFSEIMEIEREILGYPTYEFTSSSMHSLNLPFMDDFTNNPRRVVSSWHHNFLVFDAKAEAREWKIRCRSVREGNRVAFSRDLSIHRT